MSNDRKAQYARVTEWVRGRSRIVVFTHRRPDGDALGSIAGFARAVQSLGRNVELALFEPWPAKFEYMRTGLTTRMWSIDGAAAASRDFDGVAVLDTCAFAQLEPAAEYLKAGLPTLVIDHHATSDPIGVGPGDVRLIDGTAGAAALLVAEWIASVPLTPDAAAATALYVGLATDTGWFRYSNTDARLLRVAADMLDCGAVPNELYRQIYEQESAAKVRLIGRLLGQMELLAGGRLAVQTARLSDFAAAGADRTQTEDIVNQPMCIDSVVASLLFIEEPDGVIRVNLRSKHTLDVASLAKNYGGGGHARAAGLRLKGDWEQQTRQVVDAAATGLVGP